MGWLPVHEQVLPLTWRPSEGSLCVLMDRLPAPLDTYKRHEKVAVVPLTLFQALYQLQDKGFQLRC